jgi:HB1, ASXL, restriction endonuclease HTH domain
MPASNLGWREAIIEVFKSERKPLHYTDIAELIAERGLKTDFGATPANSVAAIISMSIQKDGNKSPFVKIGGGLYALREKPGKTDGIINKLPEVEEPDETGLINAFGMYWARDRVLWTGSPKILGQQQPGSKPVDFCLELGVYLLHDGRNVVYVGRTTDQPLGRRLFQHTSDRLNGRWDRFSWFGVNSVSETGSLEITKSNYTLEMLIITMEALLIEGLEPPQNRKRGDDFRAIEYLQVEDPEINKSNMVALMEVLKSKL